MRAPILTLLAALTLALSAGPALAHFGMAIPSTPAASAEERSMNVTFSFSHPFADHGMILEKPVVCGVAFEGEKADLLNDLKETAVMGHKSWSVNYKPKRPGVYTFYMEPKPYWEPAEDCFIVHYTKVSLPAFGGDSGWDEPLGLKTEIVPLLRPFGNYAGNAFTGQVLMNGAPVPNSEVEVELYNQGRFSAPTEYHETQVIKADENGIFSFTCPKPGWWGFAALNTADETLQGPDGTAKDIELGAVFWTYMHDWQGK